MDKKSVFSGVVLTLAVFVLIGFATLGLDGGALIAYGGSTATTTVTITNAAPTVSSVNINGTNPATITLTPNTTTNVNVEATVTDNNGCTDINAGTTTILLYRSAFTSSTCLSNGGADASNCYLATVFTASSTCSTSNIISTTTFAVQYYARATDASSSFASNNWQATVIFKDPSNATGSADSSNNGTTNDFATLTGINVTTSSINYGSLGPGTTSAVSTTTVSNVGNSSSTLQLSASTILTSGGNTIAADYQHYATSSFTWGTADVHLSTTSAAIAGFTLTAPTSAVAITGNVFWALQPPAGTATGTYAGVNQFTSVFTP